MKKLDPYDGQKGLEELEQALLNFESMDEHEFIDFYNKINDQKDLSPRIINAVSENFWDYYRILKGYCNDTL